ncbi:hypothetical protein RI129_011011 [Pyrocoelia pectoralis]|uniref:SAP domain-containing protein n=1 Tax=Pyrocoelia pectoralis TaxID=417401 RepID=A0AAN7V042_9COLE
MSSIDPAKLKVVELRAELTSRGLDAKGNKPVLVKRLKDALEQETQQEIPNTSIADTSTEDLNASQESVDDDVLTVPPDKSEEPSENEEKAAEPKDEIKESAEPLAEPVTAAEPLPEPVTAESAPEEIAEEAKADDVTETEIKTTEISENGENADQDMLETTKTDEVQLMDVTETENKNVEQRGEKRRRSPSPEKVQRKRSKSPIKENEPTIDNNKVQLSWYDSDLHLQIDKKTFLSGKPYHEGAFGYAWAGVRTTHGVKTGKVFFEVKITEELKWEDLVRQSDRRRDHRLDNTRRGERQRNDRERSERENKRSRTSHQSKNNTVKDKSDSEPSANEATEDSTVTDDKAQQEMESEQSNTIEEENSSDQKPQETAAEIEEKESITVEQKDNVTQEEDVEMKQEDDTTIKQKEDIEMKQEDDTIIKQDEDIEMKPEVDSEIKQENKPEAAQEIGSKEAQKEKIKDESTEQSESMALDETSTKSLLKHLIRVGWSISNSTLQLGEVQFSYGYESTGKYVANKTFTPHGAKFGVGDVIGAYLSITDDIVTFSFTINGELQPEIASIPKSELPENCALFPHILVRNYCFDVNLGASENPWYPSPADLSDYVFLLNYDDKIQGPLRPEKRSDCEVIMMCGLPASGKTHWVQHLLSENSEKQYTVIGNSHLLERMTVNGKPLKNFYKGRWNIILDRLMKCVNLLVEQGALRRRNFIIDQTNVFPSAQRRKMRLFEGFKRRAVVVVVGDDEQAKRQALQEAQDGKDVPDSAILEMKANMCLPKQSNWLEEVTYVELNEEEATAVTQKYNQQGRDAGFGPLGSQRSGGRDNRTIAYRWDHSTSRRDYRGGYRDNRHQGNRYDRSRQHGNWQNRRPPPGSWNRDIRRDNRGSSRDYRNNNRSSGTLIAIAKSGSRDSRSRSHGGNNYNRIQRSQSNRNQPANWQGNNWNYQGNWGGQGSGTWGQGNWNQGNWSGSGGGQWKGSYGQGSGYGQSGYGNYNNWNYYGEYSHNWNSQGQPQTTTAGGTMGTDSANAAYNLYSQQAAWAQYSQQYPSGNQSSESQQSIQK